MVGKWKIFISKYKEKKKMKNVVKGMRVICRLVKRFNVCVIGEDGGEKREQVRSKIDG